MYILQAIAFLIIRVYRSRVVDAMDDSIDINGVNVCYEMRGEGDVILFLHGMGLSHDMWGSAAKAASKSYTIYAPDLPGFGDSDKPGDDYGLPYYVDVIGQFMDAVGIDNAAIVGASVGGEIAAGFAAKNPGRVSRLVLSAPVGLTAFYNGLPGLPIVSSSLYLFMSQSKGLFKRYAESMLFNKNAITCDMMEREWSRMRDPAYRAVLTKNAGKLAAVDPSYVASLRSIKAPTLIVWGQNDTVVPPADAYRYQELIKGSELSVIERCGHLPPLEKPDEFNRAFLTFLGREERYYDDDHFGRQD
jgi:pimeloyl-ACP methyl ester carboxylesterase